MEEEIAEINGRAQARADSYLQDKIEEFRRVYEIEKDIIRDRHKEELQKTLANYVPADVYAKIESQLKTITQELNQVKSDVDEKRRLLEQERNWNVQQLRQKDQLIREGNERYRSLKQEFDDLLDIKDGLQKELDTYRYAYHGARSRFWGISRCSITQVIAHESNDSLTFFQDPPGARGIASQPFVAERVVAIPDIDLIIGFPKEEASLLSLRVH